MTNVDREEIIVVCLDYLQNFCEIFMVEIDIWLFSSFNFWCVFASE